MTGCRGWGWFRVMGSCMGVFGSKMEGCHGRLPPGGGGGWQPLVFELKMGVVFCLYRNGRNQPRFWAGNGRVPSFKAAKSRLPIGEGVGSLGLFGVGWAGP